MGGAVHGPGGAEKCDRLGLIVPVHPLTAACLVKGQMEAPAVKEVGGLVHIAAGEGDIGLGGVALHPDAHHLHGNPLVRAGAPYWLEKLGRGGGEGIEQLIARLRPYRQGWGGQAQRQGGGNGRGPDGRAPGPPVKPCQGPGAQRGGWLHSIVHGAVSLRKHHNSSFKSSASIRRARVS